MSERTHCENRSPSATGGAWYEKSKFAVCASSFLFLVGGLLASAAPVSAAPAIPPPDLAVLVPHPAQVTSVATVRLTPSGPAQEIVKIVTPCSNGAVACPTQTTSPYRSGYPTRNLLLLAWEGSARRWETVFNADSSALFPPEFGFTSPIATSTIRPTTGRSDLVVSAFLTPGANSFLFVGIVHFDGRAASIVYRRSTVDGISARVTGGPSEQHLRMTIGWVTDADPICCPVRPYTQTVGWAGGGQSNRGGYHILSDTRSWLGAVVSVEPSVGDVANVPTVLNVVPGSPAAGVLEPGDIILGIADGHTGANLIGAPVIDQIASQEPGRRIALSIARVGVKRILHLNLSSYGSTAFERYSENPVGLPYFGVEAVDLTATLRRSLRVAAKSGAMIIGVMPGSPAETAGLAVGDVILAAGPHQVAGTQDLLDATDGAALSQPGLRWPMTIETPTGGRSVLHVVNRGYQPAWRFFPEVTDI